MSEHNITVEGGSSVRLLTAGKYCDRDIVVRAEGGAEDLDAVLAQQDSLVDELKELLITKASGGSGGDAEPDTRFKEFIEGTLTEVDDDTITAIKDRAFQSMESLTRVSLPQ